MSASPFPVELEIGTVMASASCHLLKCHSRHLTSLSHDFLQPKKNRQPKMAPHDLRAESFEDGCLCSILYGPLQLQIWTAFLLSCSPLPYCSTPISHTTFSQLSEPTQGSSSTCTPLFPFPARFSALHCRPPSLAFVLISTSGLSSL